MIDEFRGSIPDGGVSFVAALKADAENMAVGWHGGGGDPHIPASE
jgi:hypothetical protein